MAPCSLTLLLQGIFTRCRLKVLQLCWSLRFQHSEKGWKNIFAIVDRGELLEMRGCRSVILVATGSKMRIVF
jgi:hypothetical protein